MAKPRITKSSISKAINSLLKWLHSQPNPNPNPNPNLSIYLILTLKSIPHGGRSLSLTLPLPHSIHPHPPPLIVSDHKTNITSTVDSLPISITPISLLQDLLQHRLYIVDRRIAPKLKKMKRKKGTRIVEVDLGKKRWVEEVRRAVESTVMSFRGGTCCGIEVARAGQEVEEILENVEGVVEAAVHKVPKKWHNVRAVHVKAAESVALPIYESLEEEKRERDAVEDGEERKRRKIVA